MDRAEVFRLLRERGAAQAVVEFHGGSDEGETNGISLLDADENEIGTLETIMAPLRHVPETNENVRARELTPDEKTQNRLVEALEAPVWNRYGGFDGTCSVEGEIIWDVASETVTLDADESTFESVVEEL
jgi:hypothetical protein